MVMGLLSLLKNTKKTGKQLKEARIVMLGLDNAGKTSILKRIAEEPLENITPTKGFSIKALVSLNKRCRFMGMLS